MVSAPSTADADVPAASIRAMPVSSSLSQRARVAGRVALGKALAVVPLWAVERARHRQVLVPVLRHRSLNGLGVVTIPGTPPVRLLALDSRLLRMLYWYGQNGYEAHEVDWWRHFCRQSRGILEIGANVGYYTVQGALAAPEVPYIAVEAHPESVDVLRQNLALNRIGHVRVHHAAVVGSAACDTVELALPELEKYAAPTGAFLASVTEGVGTRRPSTRAIQVPAVAGEHLVRGVDLIKLDIEGSEFLVLSPVIEELVRHRATVLVEVLRDTPKLRALLARLADEQYRFWLVAGPELREISRTQLLKDDLHAVHGCRDLAAIPCERHDLASMRCSGRPTSNVG